VSTGDACGVARQLHTDEDWPERLNCDDETVVISALRAACPCGGSSERYEEYKQLLTRFQKDPRPHVRKVALHLQQDAFEELAKDDEVAVGWMRNRPGGNGKRGERRP
jgi:hypothetical protein